jgi:hypothetical protein
MGSMFCLKIEFCACLFLMSLPLNIQFHHSLMALRSGAARAPHTCFALNPVRSCPCQAKDRLMCETCMLEWNTVKFNE